MVRIEEIRSFIRFQISQLSIKNAHHEFERMCFDLAKQRICSNLLPSTGPVSSGGDQGRDFLSFKTYLDKNLSSESSFIGSATNLAIVGACSLQEEYHTKIKSDTTKIMEYGLPVDCILFFSGADIPISKKNELEHWARQKHNVLLDIFDAWAITNLLTDSEIFWIAEQYLSIPNDFFPHGMGPEWYERAYLKWSADNIQPINHINYHEVKSGLIHSTFNDPKLKKDIPFWIKCIEHFQKQDTFSKMRRNATYEIIVCNLRG
jgi:hypothetical protein